MFLAEALIALAVIHLVCVHHVCFFACCFSWVFLRPRVTEACPVTTDLCFLS